MAPKKDEKKNGKDKKSPDKNNGKDKKSPDKNKKSPEKKDDDKKDEKDSPETRHPTPSDGHFHHKRPRSKDDKDDKDKGGTSSRHAKRDPDAPPRRLEGFKEGGKVKHTGPAKLHKGEVVLPKAVVEKMKKLFK